MGLFFSILAIINVSPTAFDRVVFHRFFLNLFHFISFFFILFFLFYFHNLNFLQWDSVSPLEELQSNALLRVGLSKTQGYIEHAVAEIFFDLAKSNEL